MALLFADGCGEYYDTAHMGQVWDQLFNTPIVEPSAGRRSGASIQCISGEAVSKNIPITGGSLFTGFAVQFDTVVDDIFFGLFREAVGHITLELQATGAIKINYGTAQSATSSTGLITADIYHHIEIEARVADAGGRYIVKLDGTTILTNLSVDTQNAGKSGIDRVVFGDTGGHTDYKFDDVYICDSLGPPPQNTFLGDAQLDAVLADGDGVQTEFTTTFPASPTTHYTKVDENPATGDTDYNESAVVGHRDLFNFAALPTVGGGSNVMSVKAIALTKKTDAGTRSIRLITRPTSTNFNGADRALQTDYHYKSFTWDANPQTNNQWTDTLINAAQFGVEVR